MLYVAIGAWALLGLSLAGNLAYAHANRALARQCARERDLLINQMCSLAGKPWRPAPASERHEWPEPAPELIANPGHWPEDEL